MPPFRAIAFDLFNTLITCDVARLPRATIGGRERASTLPEVRRVLTAAGHAVALDQLGEVAGRVSAEQEAEKVRTGREFPASYRWTAILAELDIPPAQALVEAVVRRHMASLCAAWDISAEDRAGLVRLADSFTLALVSNFDHGPSARDLLDRLGLSPLFAYIGISEELGWRKPEVRVFRSMLEALQVQAAACLYVGDSLHFDVAGAHAAGMRAAWIVPEDASLAREDEPPAYRATSVAALAPQLEPAAP